MTHSYKDIGLHLRRLPKFRWMLGMRVVSSPAHDGATGFFYRLHEGVDSQAFSEFEYPDLTDPATRGCLLHLVRAAWDKASLSPLYSEYEDRGGEWSIVVPVAEDGMLTVFLFTGRSEEEVLVKALEAAR